MKSQESPSLSVEDLVKVFVTDKETIRAVDGVSFEVAPGEVFGFLGPNGAGKTTTLEIIEGLIKPTSGGVRIFGMDALQGGDAIKKLIGVQLQKASYFEHLRLHELLNLFALFYGQQVDAAALLEKVGLLDRKDAKVKHLSGGQNRRFSIAMSLVNDPQLVFLDEPTSGLDPQARRLLWEMVREVASDGKTVVMTTHYMDEAEALCDRVAIIDNGKIVALDTPLGLIRSLDSAYHVRFTTPDAIPKERLLGLEGAGQLLTRDLGAESVHDLELHDPAIVLSELAQILHGAGVRMTDLRIEPSTLEDVFLSLTGRKLRD